MEKYFFFFRKRFDDRRHNPALFVVPDVGVDLRPPEQEEASEGCEKAAPGGRSRQFGGDFH